MPLEAVNAAEQELNDFSYIVSHDLIASFRHVAEFSRLAIREMAPDGNTTLSSYGGRLEQATAKCSRQMDELLKFSRVQQGALRLARCDAKLLMEMATLQLSDEVRTADAKIDVGQLPNVVVDVGLMTLAFKHVLSNSIKFRSIETAPRIEVTGSETPEAYIIRVADNGIGISMERQERLFRMFYQDHQEGAYPGEGAGLAICRRILRRHGGDAVFSDVPSGACVEITLPRLAGFVGPVQEMKT